MADFSKDWTEETYRLDEVARKFELPQVIQVTEGIDTGNDIDSFSAEDILMIDQSVVLQKVAAQFAEKVIELAPGGSEYAILKEEILIPLNYKGKLKVLNETRKYHGVADLARDFPRYATVLEAVSVPTESGGTLNIAAGTTIELDRVIPSHKGPDRLVISTEPGGRKQVAMPFDMKARFRSVRDENEYTLKETIDRYSLPKLIQFLDDKIQKIYTQDLLEGVEQMANVTTSVLQINRLVLQRVLIGHYKEPIESQNKSEKFCKRTLVVIPLDMPGIGEISVKAHIGEKDDPIYETFLVKNVNTEQAEGLYVEFLKRPRIVRFEEDEDSEDNVKEANLEAEPPPIPPRPGQSEPAKPPQVKPKPKMRGQKPNSKPGQKPNTKPHGKSESKAKGKGDYVDFQPKNPKHEEDEEAGDYEIPENPPVSPKSSAGAKSSHNATSPLSPKASSPYTAQKSASMPFSLADIYAENVKNDNSKDKSVIHKVTGLFKSKKPHGETVTPQAKDLNQSKTVNEDTEDNIYEEPKEDEMDAYEEPPIPTELNRAPGKPLQKTAISKERPVAKITPQAYKAVKQVKEFRLLKKNELEERLTTCGMTDFAKFCSTENLDGEFIYGMTDDMMKTLKLTKYQRQKLKRIINGWIPDS